MTPVSQTTDQNSRKNRHKIHLAPQSISGKIVAFHVIADANNKKSAREIAELIQVPNSTMQTWRKQEALKNTAGDEVSIFFATPTGSAFLHRMVVAIMYNNKCGASGICGAQECLRNSGLDKYVASSAGALQAFWHRCEDSILSFGKIWEHKLAEGMKHRKITVILDEMFRKRMPCLVAIEAVSNYILLEKFTEDRTAKTRKRELDHAIKELPVTIDQVASDLCGALRSLTKEYNAVHSSDLFHGQYEISKATGGALSSQERAAEKALTEIESDLAKMMSKPTRIGKKNKKRQKEDIERAEKKRETLKVDYQEKKARREQTREAKRKLGQVYHPIDLETGKIQSAETVEKRFAEQFKVIGKNAENAGLSQPCHDRIEKAERAFALMIKFLKHFFVVMTAILLDMKLTLEQKKFFEEVIFPLSYLNMIWKRLPKKEKARLGQLLAKLQEELKNSSLTEEFKEALMKIGKETAETFQRSSSNVEGRNGVLSLLMHRFHYLSEKTLRVLSVVHNFGVKRKGEATTAAERFFGGKHDELFGYLVANVRIPRKPQVQIRKKSRWAA